MDYSITIRIQNFLESTHPFIYFTREEIELISSRAVIHVANTDEKIFNQSMSSRS